MQISKINTNNKDTKFHLDTSDKWNLGYFSLAGTGIYLANDIPKMKNKTPLAKTAYLTGSVIKGTGMAFILTLILKTLKHIYLGDFKNKLQ